MGFRIHKSIREYENEIFEKWKEHRVGLVKDGLVSESHYFNANYKLVFILKEVNGGENWDLREFLSNGGQWQSWDNVCRWIYGIFNIEKSINWKDLQNIDVDFRKQMLKHIGAVNLKKTSGKDVADNKEINRYMKEDSEYLIEQLDLYFPNFYICCGTQFPVATQDVKMTSKGLYYGKYKESIVVFFSHPAARCSYNLLYYGLVDGIREIIKTENIKINTTKKIDNSIYKDKYIYGYYQDVCNQKISKYKNFKHRNMSTNIKIYTALGEGFEDISYSDYNLVLVNCDKYSDFQQYLKFNENCIWFNNEQTLIKFVEYLHVVMFLESLIPIEYLDLLSLFCGKDVPICYEENINNIKECSNISICFFGNERVLLDDFNDSIIKIKESIKSDHTLCFGIIDMDIDCPNWIFYC